MSLPCGCIEGAMTNEEHHESWCPAITDDFMGLPVVSLDTMPPSVIAALDTSSVVEENVEDKATPTEGGTA